jgi:putative membrane protein
MLQILFHWLIRGLAIYIIAAVVPGIRLRGFSSALSVAAVYSFINFLLFKVLLFITFPLVILKFLTLGLVGIALNVGLIVITDKLLEDFELKGLGPAVIVAIGISLVNLGLTIM